MPAHINRAPEEGSAIDPVCVDQHIDISDPSSGIQNSKSPSNPDSSEPEMDFGPWLIVSRQRGGNRGRGGGSRATHVTSGSAATRDVRAPESRGAASHSV